MGNIYKHIRKIIFVIVLVFLFEDFSCVCGMAKLCKPGDLGEPRSSFELGSASNIDGSNVIISVFVDTPSRKWSEKEKERSLEYLSGACDYISSECDKYGASPDFIYDWKEDAKLLYNAKILREPGGDEFEEYLDKHIAVWVKYLLCTHFENTHNDHFLTGYDRFKDKYEADNIFLICFFNMDGRAYAICYDGIDSPNESLVAYRNSNEATLAHEILHLFGTHDFYEGAEYTSDAVKYIMGKYPNDIMLKTTMNNDKIKESLGELSAYHLGLLDSVEDIEVFPQLLR